MFDKKSIHSKTFVKNVRKLAKCHSITSDVVDDINKSYGFQLAGLYCSLVFIGLAGSFYAIQILVGTFIAPYAHIALIACVFYGVLSIVS